MVRRKVEIKKIEDKAKRHTTFTKRRQGLFKKAKDLSDRSGDEVAVIAFSLAGNVYAFGSPSVESIVQRYLTSDHALPQEAEPEEEETEEEEEEVVEVEVMVEVKEEDLEELDELEAAVEFMKKKVSVLAKYMIKKM